MVYNFFKSIDLNGKLENKGRKGTLYNILKSTSTKSILKLKLEMCVLTAYYFNYFLQISYIANI
jgi:hypothetical protein